jgi:hypothetical protein
MEAPGTPLIAPTGSTTTERFAGWWYLPVTILTAGTMAWIPFLHAAIRMSRRAILWWAALYLALTVTIFVLLPTAGTEPNTDSATGALGGLLIIAMIIGGSIQQWHLRRSLVASTGVTRVTKAPLVQDPSVAQVLAARARRQGARDLAAKDPLMAHELHIGRPDLGGTFDDGGLVDLNSAPASAIARICDLDEPSVAMIIEARTQYGNSFITVDDVLTATELPITTWDQIRDHGIVIPR